MPEWKKCPLCGGEIHPEAKRCRHCSRMITPEAIAEFEETQRREAEAQAQRQAEEEAEAAKLRAQQEAEAVEAEEESSFGGYAVNVPPPPPIPTPAPTPEPQPIANPYDYQYSQPDSRFEENTDEASKPSFFGRYFVGTYLKNYANFSGETSRRNYWLSCVAYAIIVYALGAWVLALTSLGFSESDAMGGAAAVALIVALSMIIPGLALSIRRMHNLGKSGWYILLNCIPFVNIYYLVLLFTEGNRVDDTGSRFKWSDWLIVLSPIAGLILFGASLNSRSSYDYDYDYEEATEWVEVNDDNDYAIEAAEEVVEAPAVEEASNIGYDGYATDEAEEEDESDYDW